MPKISVGALFVAAALTSLALCTAPLFAATPAQGRAVVAAAASGSVLDVAAADGHFTTFLTAVKAADLGDVLAGIGPITVFAPTDAAFAKVPPARLADLMKPENKPLLRAFIQGLIVVQAVPLHDDSGDLSSGSLSALSGGALAIGTADGSTTVNGAKVVERDKKAANGYLDGLDTVLMPATQTAANT